LDHPVEQRAIVKPFFGQLNKIVPVLRCFVIQTDNALAIAGSNAHILVFWPSGESAETDQ
ncbi:MAG: hypothetical protein JWQ66_2804, partial [Mucilaginibacter sp.]|nr:hypothetical protein [Mucilaginibacter sp.]